MRSDAVVSITSTAGSVPFEIQRADFLALCYVLVGMVFLSPEALSLIGGGSVALLNAGIATLWFTMAGWLHYNPDRMDKGTDLAPRTWFEVAGLVIALGILAIVIEFLLFSVL
jgi:hypothetical protein